MNNKQADKIFVGKWVKKSGKLVFKFKHEEELFHSLAAGMREGQQVDIAVDFSDDLGRLSQISKLKAGCRELAKETGETFINTENLIKKEAGLFDEISKEYKSFANCSIEQLSSAIQVMVEKGDFVGINLK